MRGDWTLLPWIEDNQGLLSLLALVAALAIALWEWWLRVDAERDAFKRDIEIAIDVINLAYTYYTGMTTGNPTLSAREEFREEMAATVGALNAMASSRAHSAPHALALQIAARKLLWVQQVGHADAWDQGNRARMLANFTTSREGLVALQTTSKRGTIRTTNSLR